VVTHQARLIDLFGGLHGVRGERLLDSALAQPEATFAGEYLHGDVWEMAAACADHLCSNHPFLDGNKRIAAAAMGTFLGVNGHPRVVAASGRGVGGR
jgi:death-on-curing protein